MGLRSTGFVGEDETCTDPDGGSTEHQGASERLSAKDTSGRDALNRLASELGWGGICAHFGDGRDEDAGGSVTLACC